MGFIFASIQCSSWLVDMEEEAIQSPVKEDFAKSYHEGDKATMVHGGGNKAGSFFEVSEVSSANNFSFSFILYYRQTMLKLQKQYSHEKPIYQQDKEKKKFNQQDNPNNKIIYF